MIVVEQFFNSIKGRTFGYDNNDKEFVQGTAMQTIVEGGIHLVLMSDNTKIPIERFPEIVIPMDSIETDDDEGNGNNHMDYDDHNTNNSGNNKHSHRNIPTMNIRMDKNGMPILATEEGESNQQPTGKNHKQPQKQIKVESDPILVLLDKAKYEDIEFVVKLKIPVIKKSLFETINDSFPEEETKAKVIKHLISKIDSGDISNFISEEIKKYYSL